MTLLRWKEYKDTRKQRLFLTSVCLLNVMTACSSHLHRYLQMNIPASFLSYRPLHIFIMTSSSSSQRMLDTWWCRQIPYFVHYTGWLDITQGMVSAKEMLERKDSFLSNIETLRAPWPGAFGGFYIFWGIFPEEAPFWHLQLWMLKRRREVGQGGG